VRHAPLPVTDDVTDKNSIRDPPLILEQDDAIASKGAHAMAIVPEDPETRLTRQQLAEALTTAGFPISPATLATKACRGGGPPFQRWGRYPSYTWGPSLEWARQRLSRIVNSTSELDGREAA
jgi:hypothetical protein